MEKVAQNHYHLHFIALRVPLALQKKLTLGLVINFSLFLLFRMMFCSQRVDNLHLYPGHEKMFVRCEVSSQKLK